MEISLQDLNLQTAKEILSKMGYTPSQDIEMGDLNDKGILNLIKNHNISIKLNSTKSNPELNLFDDFKQILYSVDPQLKPSFVNRTFNDFTLIHANIINGAKLAAVKHIKDIYGIMLKESKQVMDNYISYLETKKRE